MKKILIQLTFNNGLGNLYCGMINLLDMVSKYKEIGYTCDLVFASNGSSANKYIDYCEFGDIFDLEYHSQFFNKIENKVNAIKDKKYNNLVYHSTQFLSEGSSPGEHWWDIFLPEGENLKFDRVNGDVEIHMKSDGFKPKILPKLSKKVLENIKIFKNNDFKNALSIRHIDYNINVDEKFKNDISRIDQFIKNSDEKFYITSNNQYALDTLSKNTNVTIHTFDNIEELPNDHGYYLYNKEIDRETLMKRLNDNLSEMVYLSHFKNLYHYTSYSWISSFLYYPLVNNNKIKLINIKTKI